MISLARTMCVEEDRGGGSLIRRTHPGREAVAGHVLLSPDGQSWQFYCG